MHEPTDVGAMRLILTGLAATTMLATPLGAQIATPKLPTPVGYPATRTVPVTWF